MNGRVGRDFKGGGLYQLNKGVVRLERLWRKKKTRAYLTPETYTSRIQV